MNREEVIIDSLVATIEEKNDLIIALQRELDIEKAKRLASEEAFRNYVVEQELKEDRNVI